MGYLSQLSAADILEKPVPLRELLVGSLYYPSSGFDANVIRYCNTTGRELDIDSYVYCDYGISEEDLMGEAHNFLGYHILASRPLTYKELLPHGWDVQIPPGISRQRYTQYSNAWRPFARWIVYERDSDYAEDHGVARFSLMYLGTEGVATYQALYWMNKTYPKALAIIQPGHGFGLNWTDFTKPNRPFAWIIYNNPHGLPETLFYGGVGGRPDYDDLEWPGYQKQSLLYPYYGDGSGCVVVWGRA